MQTSSITQDRIEYIRTESERFGLLIREVSKVVVGQEHILKFIVNAILCSGHILLEGVPGVAKTTMIKAINQALGLSFKRIQFTPDLLPADLIGSLVYNAKTHEFETRKGPIFANLILADEINRAPAKVQSALLEAMEEKQVTIGSETFQLERPFLVFATQNPLEQEGTYRLPEAQVDRFMFKLLVTYPTKIQEKQIIQQSYSTQPIQQVLTRDDIFKAQELVKSIYLDDKVTDYIIDLVCATRSPGDYKLLKLEEIIQHGVSPRASLALNHAARAHAFLAGRHYVTPDDVKHVAPAILRHRITLSYHAEAEGMTTDDVVRKILQTVPTP
jgi:MoxR-like ATPase